VLTGKAHINVLPPVALNKGTAVRSLVESRNLEWALIAGDDVTDIDAFREARALADSSDFHCTNVAVLGEDCPAGLLELADYALASVTEMERFLTWWAGPGR
jgi:trehalose 6-phosphate phosphatase